jgi:hypothetical protein
MAEENEPPPHSGGGGGITKKKFGAPVWIWAVGLGGAVGLFYFWRRSKSSTDTTSADASSGGASGGSDTSLVPINEGLSEDQTQSILDAIKKMHGPPSDDDDDDDDKPPPAKTTLPAPVTSKPPVVKPKPPPKRPKTVTVVKWTKDHTPWNSTLWGIATHEHVNGGWQYLQKINHITGDPKKALKPGMKIKLSA